MGLLTLSPRACYVRPVPGSLGSTRVNLPQRKSPLSFARHYSSSLRTNNSSNYGGWFRSRLITTDSRIIIHSSSETSRSTNTKATRGRADGLPAVWNTVNGCLDPLPDPSTGPLKWYSCGPTVYDSAHLGHARTYVCLDIIRRVLADYFRFDVTYALGITDVDDKIIARARERGLREWAEIAEMAGEYEEQFMEDMAELGVLPPDAVARVTDHIPDIVAYIERIVENGMAYEAESGVYFDVESLGSGYGKLGVGASESTTPEGDGGSDLRGKRSHRDFALWKRSKPNEPWWESPFGSGRPGWHIECSAMTHAIFGPYLDLHSGGVDLKFPHHTNEIAQCEAHNCGGGALAAAGCDEGEGGGDFEGEGGAVGAKGKPWVKHWIHTGHLNIEGLKMSKSLKNFVTVREYLDGHAGGRRAAAEDFRMFCLIHKYNSTVTYSEDRMEEARVLRQRFERMLALADSKIGADQYRGPARRWGDGERRLVEETLACRRQVRLALNDDFDTPRAVRQLATLCALVSTHLKDLGRGDVGPVASTVEYIAEMLSVLGLGSSARGVERRFGYGLEASPTADRAEDSAERLPPVRDVIAAMVDLRRLVRKQVLERKLGKEDSTAKLMKMNLLQLVDRTRDEVLPGLGVHVHDLSHDESPWMLLPPNPQRGRRQPCAAHDKKSLGPDYEAVGSDGDHR